MDAIIAAIHFEGIAVARNAAVSAKGSEMTNDVFYRCSQPPPRIVRCVPASGPRGSICEVEQYSSSQSQHRRSG